MASRFLARFLGGLFLLSILPGPARLAAADMDGRPRTEQEWVIDSITRDVFELARFAAAPGEWAPLAPAAVRVDEWPAKAGERIGAAYLLRRPGHPVGGTFTVATHPWDPQPYAELPGASFPAAPGPAAPDEEAKLFSRLAGLAGSDYVAENRRLSWHLGEHPADPAAHEQAAFLLAALALRENAGLFHDPRPALNRAVAHLAVARGLRRASSPGTDAGALAEVLVAVVLERSDDAARRIASLRPRIAARPELGPWLRAAETRRTRDPRVLPSLDGATALERVECFRAFCESVDANTARRRFVQPEFERLPDWSRTLLQFDVLEGRGQEVSLAGLSTELRELAEVIPLDVKSPDAVAAALNAIPGRALRRDGAGRPELNVIDPGQWGAFFQRHLLHVGSRTYHFSPRVGRRRDEADNFAREMERALGKLTLYPFAAFLVELDRHGPDDRRGRSGSHAETPPGAVALLHTRPELAAPAVWEALARSDIPGGEAPPVGIPSGRAWFRPAVPEGTALSALARASFLPRDPAQRIAEVERLHALARSYRVAAWLLQLRAGDRPSREEWDRLIAPFLESDRRAMRAFVAREDSPAAEAVRVAERLAREDLNQLIILANLYRRLGRTDDAIRTYERAIPDGPDKEGLVSELRWLVDQLLDRGERERAEQAAQVGADWGSVLGLEAIAHFMERTERWKEAEEYHERNADRYHTRGPLALFYRRRAAADPAGPWAEKYRREMAFLFPNGMGDAKLPDSRYPPAFGVIVESSSVHIERAGLKAGTIIVALDGTRVTSLDQYSFIREMKTEGPLELIVWQDGAYREVRADPPGRIFQARFRSWPRQNDRP